MPVAWRLTSARRAETAFIGEGSMRQSGRWHRTGTRCVYTSSALSLAALEVMVHSGGGRPAIPFIAFKVEIPDDVTVSTAPEWLMADDWRAFPAPARLAEFGTSWVNSMAAAVLRVPSAVSPREFNFLLNPVHPDFERLAISAGESYEFDERLLLGLK